MCDHRHDTDRRACGVVFLVLKEFLGLMCACVAM